MVQRILFRRLVLVAGLALALPVFAAPMKKTIHIGHPLQVGDKTLVAGDYKVVVDGNETTFTRDGKVVVTVPCAVEDGGTKSRQDAVIYENGAITEILFAGQSQVVKINPTPASSGAPKSNATVR